MLQKYSGTIRKGIKYKPRKSHRYTKKANPINDESVATIADRQRQVVHERPSSIDQILRNAGGR